MKSSPNSSTWRTYLTIGLLLLFTVFQLRWVLRQSKERFNGASLATNIVDSNGIVHRYGRHSPFILVSGYPLGGAAVLRQMLDSHSGVVCGAETELVETMLAWSDWLTNDTRDDYLEMEAAGLPDQLVFDAFAAMFLQLWIPDPLPLPKNEPLSQPLHFCHYDSLALMYGPQLKKIFPNVRVVFVSREVESLFTELKRTGLEPYKVDFSRPPEEGQRRIMRATAIMREECAKMNEGAGFSPSCLEVKYENLVEDPTGVMERVWAHVGLPYEEGSSRLPKLAQKEYTS